MNTIDEAFAVVQRSNFLTEEVQYNAAADTPLPIGYGQTNSQPTTVRRMLEWLDPRAGEKILDIGYGSGWTTALLAYAVGPTGMVYAVEKIPELAKFGVKNCQRASVQNAHFFEADGRFGLPRYAPYDRILVSAAAVELPPELLEQLRPNGKMVIPIQNDILEITKISETEYKTIKHSGYVFVPLV